jgi:hypothetical protein
MVERVVCVIGAHINGSTRMRFNSVVHDISVCGVTLRFPMISEWTIEVVKGRDPVSCSAAREEE